MAQSPLNGTTEPVDIEEEGLHPTDMTDNGQKNGCGSNAYIFISYIIYFQTGIAILKISPFVYLKATMNGTVS